MGFYFGRELHVVERAKEESEATNPKKLPTALASVSLGVDSLYGAADETRLQARSRKIGNVLIDRITSVIHL
jgi:hypothetical protein